MKLGIDWSEASTKRNAVWLVAGIIGAVMLFLDKDVTQLLVLASGVAGGIGVAFKDQ